MAPWEQKSTHIKPIFTVSLSSLGFVQLRTQWYDFPPPLHRSTSIPLRTKWAEVRVAPYDACSYDVAMSSYCDSFTISKWSLPKTRKIPKKETNERRNYLRNLDRRRVDDDVAVVSSVAVSPKSTPAKRRQMRLLPTNLKHFVIPTCTCGA